MGSNSEPKTAYGSSSEMPKKHVVTSIQPMKGFKNIVSLFVSDPLKAQYLS